MQPNPPRQLPPSPVPSSFADQGDRQVDLRAAFAKADTFPFQAKRNVGIDLRAACAKVDADVATWRQQAETLICDAVNSGDEMDVLALQIHISRVVAVRT